MDKKLKKYINKVLSYIYMDKNTKKRYKEDLTTTLIERNQYYPADFIIKDMGEPKQVALEFMKSYKVEKNNRFEYRSSINFFGLPLLHIRFGKKQMSLKDNTAIGIIAIGPIAIGVLPIGSFAFGLISIGAISVGLVSLGAISIGLLAIGAVAIGKGAIGAVAIGKLSRGAVAVGGTAIGVEARGNQTLQGENLSHLEIYQFIKTNHPNLPDWLINLFSISNQ